MARQTLAEARPEVAAEWHPTKNGDLTPSDVTRATARVAWWLGKCGHEWDAPIHRRTNMNTGCPFCAPKGRKRILPGFNDLITKRPDLLERWDFDRNGSLDPHKLAPTSKRVVGWRCPEGHTWEASVVSETLSSRGCPDCYLAARNVSTRGDLLREWDWDRNEVPAEEVTLGSPLKAHWICEAGHRWQAFVYNRAAGRGCTECGWASKSSQAEDSLADFVSTLGVAFSVSDRKILDGMELDIVIPEANIAIEFNGLYWHSSAHKDRNYHHRKSIACAEVGFQLIHVWEDDWMFRREVVESMIARKVGRSSEDRLNARSLSKIRASATQARDFLEANHIQGFAPGGEYLALSDDSGIRALVVMKRRGVDAGEWELVRFATNAIVRGGHSRLVKWFLEEHPECGRLVTFADRGVSDGGVYAACGFVRDGDIPADYMYVVGDRRVHKFNYRKARFKSDPELKYAEGLTERELAELNGLKRIYDAGKVRWVWNAKTPSE